MKFKVDSSFPSALEKCATSFRLPWFLMRNLLTFELLFPYRWCVISLWLLSRCFSLLLVFRCLTVMCFVFLWVFLSGLTQLLNSVGLCLLPNLSFHSLLLFFLTIFQLHTLPCSSGTLIIRMLNHLLPSYKSLRFYLFFSLFSFCSEWMNSDLSSSSPMLFCQFSSTIKCISKFVFVFFFNLLYFSIL